jgi:hypothetical protein
MQCMPGENNGHPGASRGKQKASMDGSGACCACLIVGGGMQAKGVGMQEACVHGAVCPLGKHAQAWACRPCTYAN